VCGVVRSSLNLRHKSVWSNIGYFRKIQEDIVSGIEMVRETDRAKSGSNGHLFG